MPLTTHAKKRLQQRGIAESWVDVLLDFGSSQRSHGGAEIIYFRHQDRLLAAGAVGPSHLPHRIANAYLIVGSNGNVVTAGHRFRRVQRS